jgi:hypothetical protein
VGSVFCSPLSWIVIALSFALVYPIGATAHPVTGVIGLFVFFLLGLFVSLTITHVLQGALARRLSLALLVAASVVGGLIWFEKQTQFVASLRSLTPQRLAVAAATSPARVRSVAALIAITALFGVIALWTFKFTLHPEQSRRSQKSTFVIQLPGRFGGLLRKDLRYSSRLFDLYLVLPIIILFDMYLITDAAPSALAFSIVIAVLFFPCVAVAFNCFGLDSALGFDRYTLFPLSGREKLFSKNLAFLVMMPALFATILPLAFWKLGPAASVLGSIEFAAVALAYVCCGNWFSVKQPFRMQFYRFASGGSLVDLVLGIMFATLPAAVTAYLLAVEDAGAIWKIAGMMLVSLALYLLSLARAGRVLESRREEIRRALS